MYRKEEETMTTNEASQLLLFSFHFFDLTPIGNM
jgi:hypothetical protein